MWDSLYILSPMGLELRHLCSGRDGKDRFCRAIYSELCCFLLLLNTCPELTLSITYSAKPSGILTIIIYYYVSLLFNCHLSIYSKKKRRMVVLIIMYILTFVFVHDGMHLPC